MKKFSMKCSCGDVQTVDSDTREGAIKIFTDMMDQKAMDEHWLKMHADDKMPKPTLDQAHAAIQQTVWEVSA